MWSALSKDEQRESYLQLKEEEERMRNDGVLTSHAEELPGSKVSLPYSVVGLMGELPHKLDQIKLELRERRGKLKSEGHSEDVIDGKLEVEIGKILKGNFPSEVSNIVT